MRNNLQKNSNTSFVSNNMNKLHNSLYKKIIEGDNQDGILYIFTQTFKYLEQELNINRYDIFYEFIENHIYLEKKEDSLIEDIFYLFLKDLNFFNSTIVKYYSLHEMTKRLCLTNKFNTNIKSIKFNRIGKSYWTVINFPDSCEDLFKIKLPFKSNFNEIKVLYISSNKGFFNGIINHNIEKYLYLYSNDEIISDLNMESVFMKIGLV